MPMHSVILLMSCVLLLSAVCIYGLHRYWMIWRFARAGMGGDDPAPHGEFESLPQVTVQLPMFNEPFVAQRIIEAAAAMDYPKDRLEIQVLDDSTDETTHIARECCQRLSAAGHRVHYIHREDRAGFKAGALVDGLRRAEGEFIAVFDADFVPPSDFLHRTIHHFTDPAIGMVQTRWSHLNRDQSLLTRIQALYLDGHFIVEQLARARSGRWFNFNGTAGVWRRRCIDDAGGWQHDTLTEDTDLSYRAQLRGWKFRYLWNVQCPAELPPTVAAFLTQQHRWNKGLAQVARKLLPAIWRSEAPLGVKIEAWFHLTAPLVHVLILLLAVLVLPATLAPPIPHDWAAGAGHFSDQHRALLGVAFVGLGVLAAVSFYIASQLAQRRSVLQTIIELPALLAVGVGISFANSRAVIEAFVRKPSPFVRTPKYNGRRQSAIDPAAGATRRILPAGAIELALSITLTACLAATLRNPGTIIGAPFIALFAIGYWSIGWPLLRDSLRTG